MKRRLVMKLSVIFLTISLIFIFSLCSTGGDGGAVLITIVIGWVSDDTLGDTVGGDVDMFYTRSTDSGTTWSTVQALNANAGTDSGWEYYPHVITDGNGIWVAVWTSDENLGGTVGADFDIVFSRSTDDGITWSTVQALNSNAGSDSGSENFSFVSTDANGNWVTVWDSNENLGGDIETDYDILFSRSIDNGVSWSTVQTLNSNAADDSGEDSYPRVITDGNGNWVTVWHSTDDLGTTIGTDYDILVSRSVDNGVSWSTVQALNSNAGSDSGWDEYPYPVTDGNGNWVIVWRSDDTLGTTIGSDYDILFSRSADNGVSWSPVQALNTNAGPDSGDDAYPSVMTDGNGNWVAAWRSDDTLSGTVGDDNDILFSRSTDNGATWSAPQALNSNAGSDSGTDSDARVTTDGNGNWVTFWESDDTLGGTVDTDSDIFFSRSTDNGVTWSPVQALNSNAGSDSGYDSIWEIVD
jgi:hypothetical protein